MSVGHFYSCQEVPYSRLIGYGNHSSVNFRENPKMRKNAVDTGGAVLHLLMKQRSKRLYTGILDY